MRTALRLATFAPRPFRHAVPHAPHLGLLSDIPWNQPSRRVSADAEQEDPHMSRKPLMAGNWKMNLNHFEAIQHVQKLAFSLTDKDYDAVDAAVLVPFTDLRSVQTLITGDK